VARLALGVGVAVVGVLSIACTIDAADAGTPEPDASPRIAQFTAAVEDELRRTPAPGVVEIRMMDSPGSLFGGAGSLWTGAGIANLLDQYGVDVRVAPELEFAYGVDFVIASDEAVRLAVMPVDEPELSMVDRAVWREISRSGQTYLFVRNGTDAPA
jgi:hypothetical protein